MFFPPPVALSRHPITSVPSTPPQRRVRGIDHFNLVSKRKGYQSLRPLLCHQTDLNVVRFLYKNNILATTSPPNCLHLQRPDNPHTRVHTLLHLSAVLSHINPAMLIFVQFFFKFDQNDTSTDDGRWMRTKMLSSKEQWAERMAFPENRYCCEGKRKEQQTLLSYFLRSCKATTFLSLLKINGFHFKGSLSLLNPSWTIVMRNGWAGCQTQLLFV